MEPAVTLRSSQPEDQEFLFAVYASTRDEELSLWGWDDNQKREFLELQFRAQGQQYSLCYPQADSSVILLDDYPVGRLLFDRNGTDIMLVDIAVLPEYQNRSIGTKVIQLVLQEANGAQRNVALHVRRENRAARLYERLGFTVVNDDGVYLEMKCSPGEDS
jgi:ribosomal protein S18 acetylase RimI-like enzyme